MKERERGSDDDSRVDGGRFHYGRELERYRYLRLPSARQRQEQGRNRAGAIMAMGLSVARGNEAEVAQVGVVWSLWCGIGLPSAFASQASTQTLMPTLVPGLRRLVLLLTCSAPRLWFHALLAAVGQARPRQ